MGTLFMGDNLGVLRDFIDAETVDLVYLDPPFNSKRNYNILFAPDDSRDSHAQIKAFDDTWHWDTAADRCYRELIGEVATRSPVPDALATLVRALHANLGTNDMMAYLVMMALRLTELHRVLRPTGSLYLHCDPTASHYLKLVMDSIFGPQRFVSEIVWKRTFSHGDPRRGFGAITDTLLFYTKSEQFSFHPQYRPFDEAYARKRFNGVDPDGRRWQSVTLRSPSPRPNLVYSYRASNGRTYRPHPNGWSCDEKRMVHLDAEGRLHFPSKPTGQLRLKMYLDESAGVKVQNLWDDIPPVNSQAKERLGYPTQKPVALLERIIAASSNPGDVVLDPFCGCGTTIEAAHRLGREWIGIDVAYRALRTILKRVTPLLKEPARIDGNPADPDSARLLAEKDAHQFQDWAVRLVGGRPVGGAKKSKKGGDRGVDGELFYRTGDDGTKHRIPISVKGGKSINPGMVRELRGTMDREGAHIAVLLTAHPPTKQMRTEAARAKEWPSGGKLYPRIQILTVDDLFEGRGIEHPGDNVTEGTNPPPEQLWLFDRTPKQRLAKPKPLPLEELAGAAAVRPRRKARR